MIKLYTSAKNLPDTWDHIFSRNHNNYAMRSTLTAIEASNPCNQRYVIINDRSALIIYDLKLNVFTYSGLKLNMPVNIVGIPCSVSEQGYLILKEDMQELESYIRTLMKLCIMLNSDDDTLSDMFIRGETLSTCKIDLTWNTFNEYISSLRSHYRYRLNKALKKGGELIIAKLESNSKFDEKLYNLYENVYDKSDFKLEKLELDFFKTLPADIYVFYLSNDPVAFVQLIGSEDKLSFVLGGIDYSVNQQYDIYMNMLIFILMHGIECNYKSIDMGQTAEDAKMKLGCIQYNKYMHIYHRNGIVRWIIKKAIKAVSYKPIEAKYNLYKEHRHNEQ